MHVDRTPPRMTGDRESRHHSCAENAKREKEKKEKREKKREKGENERGIDHKFF